MLDLATCCMLSPISLALLSRSRFPNAMLVAKTLYMPHVFSLGPKSQRMFFRKNYHQNISVRI